MPYSSAKVAGILFFIAASQFVMALVVAQALYQAYSISNNYISDLGVGSSSAYFNSSVFLLGLLVLVGAYFLQKAFNYMVLTGLLILTAIGAMGVGVFTEDFVTVHPIVSLIAFLFGGLSSIASYRLLRLPYSVVAVILGLLALGALGLFNSGMNLGLGVGGMERMIVYPILMWGAGFGGYLIGQAENRPEKQKT